MRALVLALLLTAVAAPAADAATFAVTKTADTNDGVCDLDCSLREAILAAKLQTPGEPDTITLGPGVHDNTAADFVLAIGEQLTITGAGARTTTIRELSGGDGRVFLVEQDARLTISDATVTGAQVSNGVLVTSGATLEATRMTFSGNSAPGGGGAIANSGGAVTVSESAITGNGAGVEGGGVHQGGSAPSLSLVNVTVTGNTAPSGSGVAVETGTATLRNVTLAGNAGSPDLFAAAGTTSLAGSIVGGCSGTPGSLGFNVDAGASCGLGAGGDRSGADPALGPLADNGGPTDTMAIDAFSPAFQRGGPCPPPATDQRGVPRPQGGVCDAGAFEVAFEVPMVGPIVRRLRVRPRIVRPWARPRVRYLIDRAASVRFTVQRAVGSRWRTRRSLRRSARPGANAFRLRLRGLPAGRYRLVAVGRAEGLSGPAARARFRVRRPDSVRRWG